MAQIFRPPKGFDLPKMETYVKKSGFKYDQYEKDCEAVIARLKQALKDSQTCPEAGEEIRFPVGDGYARYLVYSLKPVHLIHLDVGDAYHMRYANRLTASDVRAEIKKQKNLDKLFSEKKKNPKPASFAPL
jgi:hypothetical protein